MVTSDDYQAGFKAGLRAAQMGNDHAQDWSEFTVQYPQLVRHLDNACHRRNWKLAIETCERIHDVTTSVMSLAIFKVAKDDN
jgi:hypothetical protein